MNHVRNESREGGRLLRYGGLELVQSSIPVLGLIWTLARLVDGGSPLWGLDAEQLAEQAATIIV